MKKFRILLPLVVMMAGMASCKKDDVKTETPLVTTGVYVLNEGLLNDGNTTLTYYDFGTGKPVTDYFANVNGKGLGDTGNDLLIYGGKMYIVMNVTSHVRVAEVLTAKSIKTIDFTNGNGPDRQPRNIVAYKNKVIVSSWDNSVSIIDTTTLEVEKVITVGSNPEQMVVSGDKLFVANGGGLSGLDSTISVVSLTTYTEQQKIKVGLNPYCMAADSANNIYIGCNGDYGAVGPKLVKVNAITNSVVKSVDTAVGKIRYFDGYLYATGGWLGSKYVRKLNTSDFSQTSASFTTGDVEIQYAYGIDIDVKTGDVWITDAKNFRNTGEVFCFDKNGAKKRNFSVTPGLNPNTVAFIRQ
ncbi:YncE family protein [Niastella sp. OAS944]|uniref:YncE family protein n=1 Tax=Niastella sp. OAS944 TaxID=2664089 RepID=UPI00348F7314|nr:YVTN family beta-propeller protein [Chitinophagaceae bacterium OAS944]